MSRSQPSGLSPRKILLLLASPPEITSELVVDRIEGDTFFVRSPDLSESPPWQHQDLTLWQYPPPWLAQDDSSWAPLSPKEEEQQRKVALSTVRRLIHRLRDRPDVYSPVRKELNDLWSGVVLGFSPASTRSGRPLTDVDYVLYATLVVFDMAMLIWPLGSAPDSQPIPASINRELEICRRLIERADDIRQSLRNCLTGIGVHPDSWHEHVLFGLLLHPQGIVWVDHLYALSPSYGRTEPERGMDLAVGVPNTTYRSANKVQRAYRSAWGAQREPERPGPRPGQPRRPSDDWQEFEAYIVRRRNLGLSPQLITQDAEAQRLYQVARNDFSAVLNDQVIRRILRKHS